MTASEDQKIDILERYIGAGTLAAIYLIMDVGLAAKPTDAAMLLKQIQDEAGGR